MDVELPNDPQVRELFLRALREYSESCEPPALTPDCPFSVSTEPGVRGCGEECMDILGATGAPPPSFEVDLGDGISIRKRRSPRARRPLNPNSRPYDAKEVFLADQEAGPPSTWRIAAVLHGLVDLITSPPSDDPHLRLQRLSRMDEFRRVVDGRGMDFECHVMPHLRTAVAGMIFAFAVASQSGEHPSAVAGWASLAEDYIPTEDAGITVQSAGLAFESLLLPVMRWALTADYEELVNWQVPGRSLLDESELPLVDTEAMGSDGRWLVDRFTKTYLHDWGTDSLRREWLYQHGQLQPPCDAADMSSRNIDLAALAEVLAERSAAADPPKVDQPGLASSFVRSAVAFLQEARYIEAAALFEAIVRRQPNDPEALNNLGFCLLASDPHEALKSLGLANEQRSADHDLVDVNRMLALFVLGRKTAATDLADRLAQRLVDGRGFRRPTFLWEPGALLTGTPNLVERTDLLAYTEEVIREATKSDQ